MDTMTLARQERQRQGPWEMEVSYGEEVDLHRHFVACDKNPGHKKFVAVDKFTADDLPSHIRSDTIMGFIQVLSDLTIRVSVRHVSDKRPKTYPGSDKPYPYSDTKGNDMNMMRVGTGWLWNVYKCPDPFGSEKTCTCKECLSSTTPKTEFAHIHIYTAAHVVYDDQEATHTTCHLFFNSGSTPEACEGVITLAGLTGVRCNALKDFSRLTYVTHDLVLAGRLGNIVDKWMDLHLDLRRMQFNPDLSESQVPSDVENVPDNVPDNVSEKRHALENVKENKNRLTIIVSHPHGCSKQVSIGYCTSVHELEDGYTQYTYTTDTCPGSSGAPVFLIGRSWRSLWSFIHVHCGNCEDKKELNFSGYCLDEMPP